MIIPKTLKQTKPIARKEYKCMLCGDTIKVGEKYSKTTNVNDDGEIYDFICHLDCDEFTDLIEFNDFDDGITEKEFEESANEIGYDLFGEWHCNSVDSLHEEVQKILVEIHRLENN